MTGPTNDEEPSDEVIIIGPAQNRLIARAGPFWSARRVREVLGFTDDEELKSAVEEADLLAVSTSDDVMLFPAWQFESVGERVRVKPKLGPLFKTLRGHDAWAVAVALRAPDPFDLAGRSAVEVADAGDPENLLERFATQVHREWRQGAEHRDPGPADAPNA